MRSFKNPVSPFSAPDPFMTFDPVTGYYYALFTRGTRLELFRSRHAGDIITDNDSRIIYTPNGDRDGILGDIWAPEMHRAPNGRWYIYTSGRIKPEPSQKRLFIMEGPADDPFEGEWIFRGKGIQAWTDFWGHDVNHDWDWWKKQIRYFLPFVLQNS